MAKRALSIGALVALALTGIGSAAYAHHPPAPAPQSPSPHSIGGSPELALTFDATRYVPRAAVESATLWRLQSDLRLWPLAWLGLSASVPVQALQNRGDNEVGLGNAALGFVLRGAYPRSIELLLSTELRLPTWSDQIGAVDGFAVTPQLVLAHRARLTSYVGAAALVRLSERPEAEPFAPPPTEAENEAVAFGGVSLTHAEVEGRVELRVAHPFTRESDDELYVGTRFGLAAPIGNGNTLGMSVEAPIRAAGRMNWSAAISVTRSL